MLGREASCRHRSLGCKETLPANVIDAMLPALEVASSPSRGPLSSRSRTSSCEMRSKMRLAPAQRAALHASRRASAGWGQAKSAEVLVERARHALAPLPPLPPPARMAARLHSALRAAKAPRGARRIRPRPRDARAHRGRPRAAGLGEAAVTSSIAFTSPEWRTEQGATPRAGGFARRSSLAPRRTSDSRPPRACSARRLAELRPGTRRP